MNGNATRARSITPATLRRERERESISITSDQTRAVITCPNAAIRARDPPCWSSSCWACVCVCARPPLYTCSLGLYMANALPLLSRRNVYRVDTRVTCDVSATFVQPLPILPSSSPPARHSTKRKPRRRSPLRTRRKQAKSNFTFYDAMYYIVVVHILLNYFVKYNIWNARRAAAIDYTMRITNNSSDIWIIQIALFILYIPSFIITLKCFFFFFNKE